MCVVGGASTASGEARGAARLVVASHSGFEGASLAPWGWMRTACQTRKTCFAKEDLGLRHTLTMDLTHAYLLSLYQMHFYGREGYRDVLRRAVKGLIYLLARSQDPNKKESTDQTVEISNTLFKALTEQLDWSLDDLELDATERKIVDLVLTDKMILCSTIDDDHHKATPPSE